MNDSQKGWKLHKERCKICNLSPKIRDEIEEKILNKCSTRKIAHFYKKNNIAINHVNVHRHKQFMMKTRIVNEIPDDLEQYIEQRELSPFTTPLLIEKEVLAKLQQEKKMENLSITINFLLHNWFNNVNKKKRIRQLAISILKHRISLGWVRDRRRRLDRTYRTSITVDRYNRKEIANLNGKIEQMKFTESEGKYVQLKKADIGETLILPNFYHRGYNEISLNEAINGILRLIFNL